MSGYLKCESPALGPQVYLPEVETPLPHGSPPPPPASLMMVTQRLYVQLAELTADKIQRRTGLGDTPLHRAAKNGIMQAVPGYLLTAELFMERNKSGDTPLHIAARHGYLHQIPTVFLTQETLMQWDDFGETPLHIAAHCGQFCRVPKKFLTPEILGLRTKDQTANTLLHFLAATNRLNLIPSSQIASAMWGMTNSEGSTPRDSFFKARELLGLKSINEPWRLDLMSEKQRQKLRFFGCTWDEGLTKGQTSDAIDECVRGFPDVDQAYYNRPATKDQLSYLRPILKVDGEKPDDYAEEGKPLTYAQAKDLIREIELEKRQKREEHESSQEHLVAEMTDLLNGSGVSPRRITSGEVTKAWELILARSADKSRSPSVYAIVDALSEMFPDLMSLRERY